MENTVFSKPVPVVPVRGSVVFPHTDSLLSFGRPKSIAAVDAAYQDDRIIAIFTQREANQPDPSLSDLHPIGTLVVITQMMTTDGEIHAMVRGQHRVRLTETLSEEPYLVARVEELTEDHFDDTEVEAMSNRLVDLFRKAVNLGKSVEITTIMRILSQHTDVVELVDSVAAVLEIKTEEKQLLLEELSVKKRLEKVLEFTTHEVSVLELERTISVKTQKRFDDQMKKSILRERKHAIEQELGENDDDEDDVSEYKSKIRKAKMPKAVFDKAMKEYKRLSNMSPHNPETGYIRNYLDWLCDMPWSVITPTKVSVEKAGQVLDHDHYGLGKAKERILEFLSVMKLKEDLHAKDAKKHEDMGAHPTILCFVGPPGVGKTSIGKSIAKAIGREFQRVSLGGIRDEAELRGHRRTYVGALPGRILQGIKNAGTRNPVFMLDEIDKLGMDYRGDPSAALLEILDPEQNKEFSDHYLEVPFDLSQVMFICTANVLDTIPGPLRDRLEIIRFAGYIEEEKFHIAQKYLWPKQVKVNGLNQKNISISDEALRDVVKNYTREAGVRELERIIATICRKVAREVAANPKLKIKVAVTDLQKYLGPRKFSSQILGKSDEVGMSTGLAVTSVGGEILFVEVALMPGSGKLTLTGQLGSVMKESAKAAFTWTRAHAEELGVDKNFLKTIDVHVHVPEGATPKDGPSAGVALTTALVSAVTGIPVKRDVGMTGEVTLRGRVLEIGGVKEKVVAAHRAGLKTILLPKDNEKDMEDVPENVKKDIQFKFYDNVVDVLETALTRDPFAGVAKKKSGKPSFVTAA